VWKNRKAISTIVVTLLLIAVAIIVSLAVGAWIWAFTHAYMTNPPQIVLGYAYKLEYTDGAKVVWRQDLTVVTGFSKPQESSSLKIVLQNNYNGIVKTTFAIRLYDASGTWQFDILANNYQEIAGLSTFTRTYTFTSPAFEQTYTIRCVVISEAL